jgi:hypothetical protein
MLSCSACAAVPLCTAVIARVHRWEAVYLGTEASRVPGSSLLANYEHLAWRVGGAAGPPAQQGGWALAVCVCGGGGGGGGRGSTAHARTRACSFAPRLALAAVDTAPSPPSPRTPAHQTVVHEAFAVLGASKGWTHACQGHAFPAASAPLPTSTAPAPSPPCRQ